MDTRIKSYKAAFGVQLTLRLANSFGSGNCETRRLKRRKLGENNIPLAIVRASHDAPIELYGWMHRVNV